MILVGIDIAKDKHECFIRTLEGTVLHKPFSITNNLEGFEELYSKIISCNDNEIKVGLEATGHYSYNILGFLLGNELPTFVLNPLQTNLFRKSLTLRKTKTDKVDAKTIAAILASNLDLTPYTHAAFQNEELKSLTRYRFDKVRQRAKLKQPLARLVNILFPELEETVSTLHLNCIYSMLLKYPSAKDIAKSRFDIFAHLIESTSNGRLDKMKAKEIRNLARKSVGVFISAKAMELKHTIKLIQILDSDIAEIEEQIQSQVQDSPITTIPGISFRLAAMIQAEIGDFNRFSSPDKILAFAGLSPTTYQSGNFVSSKARMDKRGSKYLRYALFISAQYVSMWCPVFKDYYRKKRAEGKHYFVAISHVARKLVRIICHLQKTGEPFKYFS